MSSFRQLMMRKKGGGTKTLNLVSVGGATYDSDYIFTKTTKDTTKYFETQDEIDILNQNIDLTFVIKFQYSQSQDGIYRWGNSYNFSGYINSSNNFWGIVNGNYQALSSVNLTNTWYWIKIERYYGAGARFFHFSYSTDGINYTEYYSGYSAAHGTMYNKILFGVGTSTGSDYGFAGKIDFKETDIIINGRSVLWV